MNIRKKQKEYDNYKNSASKNQYRCMNCCRTIYIPRDKDKNLCPSCGHMVEKNEKNNIENIMIISRLQSSYYHNQKKLRKNEQI